MIESVPMVCCVLDLHPAASLNPAKYMKLYLGLVVTSTVTKCKVFQCKNDYLLKQNESCDYLCHNCVFIFFFF